MRFGVLVLLVLGVGCERSPRATTATPVPVEPAAASAEAARQRTWPAPGVPVDLRRERTFDLTRDGADERVIVTARGPRYDSLQVSLSITTAAGDTLWHERWPSALYFSYDPLQGKSDSTVMRIVRGHVDALLAPEHFSAAGLPAPLRSNGDTSAGVREAVTYHLAELDWRRRADLEPGDETPAEAHSRIDASLVGDARVEAVMAELEQSPAFMYYAGGEATYAIAWSERENAFVRMHSCC